MDDTAKKPVSRNARAGLRKYLRTTWTGAVAAVIAAGVLLSASASVPAAQLAGGNDGELPIRLYGLLQSVTVGETETAPDGVTLSQIVAVLERAEQEAQEQGPNFSPTVAQAAAELGMLYTTYQMQQLAFGENNKGLRLEDAPVARHAQEGAEDPAADADAEPDDAKPDDAKPDDAKPDDAKPDDAKPEDAKPDDAKPEDAEPDDAKPDDAKPDDADRGARERKERPQPRTDDEAPPAVEVSNERTSVIDAHDEDPQAGYVTYDEVVIAAVRLANMLDPSVPNALVEVEGADERQGFSLRESLLDVVSLFGGTTTGYANGRIPTGVLCPLEFAPGHMLRCDAAERLTALSALFEQQFGYPIPITDSYRSYEAQITLAGIKPHLAAVPGTSNHGWGIAVDLGNPIAGGHSPEYVWMRVHGPDYGWDNPSWARLDGSKPEPWHFEFFAAGSIPNRAIDPSDVGTWEPSDDASPRYKPALDPKPSNGSDGGVRKPPAAKPSDRPTDNPPSQKPPKPTDKPTPSPTPTPTKPDPTPTPTKPGEPTPTPTKPSPTPTPTPTEPTPTPTPTEPTPTPSPSSPSPSPSPSPSDPTCPGGEPEPAPSATPEPTPTPSPSPSAEAGAEEPQDGTCTPDETTATTETTSTSDASGDGAPSMVTTTALSAIRPEELTLVRKRGLIAT